MPRPKREVSKGLGAGFVAGNSGRGIQRRGNLSRLLLGNGQIDGGQGEAVRVPLTGR